MKEDFNLKPPLNIKISSIFDQDAEEQLYSQIGSKSSFVFEQLSFKKKDLAMAIVDPKCSKSRIELIMNHLGFSLGESTNPKGLPLLGTNQPRKNSPDRLKAVDQ